MSQNRGRTLGWHGLAVILILLAWPAGGRADEKSADGDSENPVLTEILSTWKARANCVRTLRVRARSFSASRAGATSPPHVKPLTPAQVSELVDRHGHAASAEETTRLLIEHLRADAEPNAPLWQEIEYATDGKWISEQYPSSKQVFTEHDLISTGTEPGKIQVQIENRRKHYGTWVSLGGLCWEYDELPHLPDLPWKLVDSNATTARLSKANETASLEIVVDREAKLARQFTYFVRGTLYSQRFQLGTLHCDEGVLLPEVFVSAIYHDGCLSSVNVGSPIEVEINRRLPETAFVIPAPAGTQITDFRPSEYLMCTTTEDVADVVADPAAAFRPSPWPRRHRWSLAAASAGLVLLVGIVAWTYRVRRAKR